MCCGQRKRPLDQTARGSPPNAAIGPRGHVQIAAARPTDLPQPQPSRQGTTRGHGGLLVLLWFHHQEGWRHAARTGVALGVASSTACKVASTQSSTHITVGSGGTRSARCVSLCDVRRVSCLCGSGTITKALWCRCESGQREWGCCSHEERAHEEHSPLLDHGWP